MGVCVASGCWSRAISTPGGVALCGEHLRRVRDELATKPEPVKFAVASVVYFATFDKGVTVKIGTTTSPRARFRALSKRHGPYELLAAMPGHIRDERAIHRKWRELALGHEFFRITPRLDAYMDLIRRENPRWRKMVQALDTDE